MMMSNTSMTSTRGVTLISDLTPPFAPPTSMAIEVLLRLPFRGSEVLGSAVLTNPGTPEPGTSEPAGLLGRLLDEVVDELRRRVVHLDVEVLEPAREVVVNPHGRNRDDEAERGL